MCLTHCYGFRLCNKVLFHCDVCKHEIACRYQNKLFSIQPAFAKTPAYENLPEIGCQGEPCTGEEHADTADVLVHIAIRSGQKNIGERDVKRGAELSSRKKRKASSSLSEEESSFLQTLVLVASDWREHLIDLRAYRNL